MQKPPSKKPRRLPSPPTRNARNAKRGYDFTQGSTIIVETKTATVEIDLRTDKGLFVCVGPNRGDSNLAKLLAGHDRFIMFEPHPEAAAWLRDRNAAAADRFHVVEAACSLAWGQQQLHLYNTNGVSSSLGRCTSQIQDLYQHVDLSHQGSILVQTVHLGEWLEMHAIETIKTLVIDAQGMDLAILKTLEPYLRRRAIARIIHEVDADGVQSYDLNFDNSYSAAVAFMESIGGYTHGRMPHCNNWNFDIEWILKDD